MQEKNTLVRTRMAPSPTGEYHIGHIRTVLYNYALARQNNGQFLIRIEDTDRERYVDGAAERILDVIKDYGFDWDEGPIVEGPYSPYFQSQRLPIYKKYAEELVAKGQAYYCFCSAQRLTQLRDEQKAQGLPTTKYDRKCVSLSKEEVAQKLAENQPHVIRLRLPDNEVITFHDEVLGDVSINSNDIDDQVLLKSDGFPTYQLAVVIDDHLMGITHVMRGMDWIPSTPKHALLYRYFGWEMPKHVHLPNLKELGGSKKLSKRFGSVAAIEFLQEGYLPRALVNFLMFLGWNPGTEKEIYTLQEFIKDFSIERLQKTDLVSFDRAKLLWFNAHYLHNTQTGPLWHEIKSWAAKFGYELNGGKFEDTFNHQVLDLVKDRMQVLSDFNKLTGYFYSDPHVEQNKFSAFTGSLEKAHQIISNFIELYTKVDTAEWNHDHLDKISHAFLENYGYKPKEAFMTLRVAITGETATPPIFDILAVLGKEAALRRLQSILK